MTDSRTLLYVVGARPNFMKIAPLSRRADQAPVWTNILVHTGQHYDDAMSDAYFRDLGVRQPDIWLGADSGSHGAQTARVLAAIDDVLVERRPHLVVVVGDVNSLAAALLVEHLLAGTYREAIRY